MLKIYFLILLIFLGFAVAPKVFGLTLRPNNMVLPFMVLGGIIYRKNPFGFYFFVLIACFLFFTVLNYDQFYFSKGLAASMLLFFSYFQFIATTNSLLVKPEVNIAKTIDFLIQLGFLYLCIVDIGVVLNLFGIENELVAPNWQAALYNDAELEGKTSTLTGYHTLTACYLASVAILLIGKIFFFKSKSLVFDLFRLLIFIVALLSSYSRGAWVSLAIGAIILLFYYIRMYKIKILSLKVLLPILIIGLIVYLSTSDVDSDVNAVLANQFSRILSVEEGTGLARLEMWTGMMTDISQNPFIGRGGGAFMKYVTYTGSSAENFFLEVFQSAGIFGFIAVVAPLFILSLKSIKYAFNKKDVLSNPFLVIVFAASIGLIAPMATTPGAWGGFFWLIIGLWTAVIIDHKKRFRNLVHQQLVETQPQMII